MFDAKSILEAMVRGAAPRSQHPSARGSGAQEGGGLGDLLGQLGRMMPQQGGTQPNGGASAAPGGSAMPGLDDLLRQLSGAAGHAGQSATETGRHIADGAGTTAGGAMGGLGDILGKLQEQLGQGGKGGVSAGGNIMDVLGQVLGQATAGVKEGAGRIGAATGANEAFGKASGGMSPEDIMAKLKDLIANNQFGAGAAAGGLGAVVLGTKTGRGIAASAAKLGALALIGGLAYKAFQNYQAGKPLISNDHTVEQAAPDGSGFEPDSVTNEAAILYIRAMVAAAAADGRVDKAEMDNIVGSIKQAGFDAAAEEFLAGELNNPASIDSLVESCVSQEQAVQVYTAARIAVGQESTAETAFLAELADKLGLPADLARHIDAAANNHAAA